MTAFYNPPEETAGEQEDERIDANEPPSTSDASHHGSGRRLGDESTDPQSFPPASSSQPARPPKRAAAQKKFATLGDFGNESHGHDDPNDSDYDDEKHNLFAGGEKSGLVVQNPDDLKKKILEKARQ